MWAIILANWKGAAAFLIAGTLFATGVSVGKHWSKEQVLALQVADAQKDASQAHQALQLTQDAITKQAEILDAYRSNAAKPDPAVSGLAGRLQVVTTGICAVPPKATDPGRPAEAAGVPSRDESAERLRGLTQDVFDACRRDAERLGTFIQLTQ